MECLSWKASDSEESHPGRKAMCSMASRACVKLPGSLELLPYHCDPECEHPLTGVDGGDCRLQGRCYSWNRRDGLCHVECNNMLNDFDDGDCCDPEVTDVRKTCFDPDSPKR